MPLTLKIISKQRHILGADSLRVFSVHGGSIGRAADNDWVLPDPDRYISGHHAAIDYRAGNYYLRDTSTNGVFVNHSTEPVGRGTPLRLYDGDELRMGDYVFETSIVNVSHDGADDSGDGETEDSPERRLKRRTPAAPLSLKLLGDEADQLHEAAQEMMSASTVLLPDEELASQLDPNAFANTVVPGRAEMAGIELSPDESVPAISGAGLALEPSTNLEVTDGRDFLAAVRLLMESAGLESARLQHGDEQQTVVAAGRFIRATVESIQAVLRTRTLIKTQVQVETTGIQPAGNNPMKIMPVSQEALEQMFYGESEGYMDAVESVEDALNSVRIHQAAMVRGMQAAFRDLLARLDPDTLERKFQPKDKEKGKGKLGGLLSRPAPAAAPDTYWEQYREIYEQLSAHNDDLLLRMVSPKFASAYAAEVQYLESRKQKEDAK